MGSRKIMKKAAMILIFTVGAMQLTEGMTIAGAVEEEIQDTETRRMHSG